MGVEPVARWRAGVIGRPAVDWMRCDTNHSQGLDGQNTGYEF